MSGIGENATSENNTLDVSVSPANWMRDRLAADAISVNERLPANDTYVLVWVSDAAVAIHHFPTPPPPTLSPHLQRTE